MAAAVNTTLLSHRTAKSACMLLVAGLKQLAPLVVRHWLDPHIFAASRSGAKLLKVKSLQSSAADVMDSCKSLLQQS